MFDHCNLYFANISSLLLVILVQVPGPKKWLILRVGLTHLVESRDLFFLEAEIVNNIFQWDVLKNMRQIKSFMACFMP